ncbi:MAG: hypothetical protein K2W96_20540 [Gemmataceae bacterium]|nr:hypothetical protein [Gemmataceae bacterium]
MKRSTFVASLLALTGLSLAARHTVSGGADASLARPAKPHLVPDIGAASYVKATAPAEPEGLALARIAAGHGERLLARAEASRHARKLLAEASAHLKACLAFETMGRRDPLFAEARASLARVEELMAQARTLRAPRVHAEPKDTAKGHVSVLAPKAAVIADEEAMVGPDGVTYRRER